MILKVNGQKIDNFNDVAVSLRYDSVGSVFSFQFQFDPENEVHRSICKPLEYPSCTIEHNGQLLLTGTILSHRFRKASTYQMVQVSGYSKPGVLEDCQVPKSCYPLQFDNLSLKTVAEKIVAKFGVKLIIDPIVEADANKKFKNTRGGEGQTCKEYIAELAAQRNIMLSHDTSGNLVLTALKTEQQPVFEFNEDTSGISFDLDVNGQRQHSGVMARRGGNKKKAPQYLEIANPMVSVYRPSTVNQTINDELPTESAARNRLSDDLSAITLNIDVQGWTFDKKLIMPNSIVTVQSKELYLFKRNKWFVESVELRGDSAGETCQLKCVLPEVYNRKTPKNIFL